MNLRQLFLKVFSISAFLLVSNGIGAQQSALDTFYLYFLGGQSNMDGYGYNKDLTADLNKTFEEVWIFHGNSQKDDNPEGGVGVWDQLRPGHGMRHSATAQKNKLSDRFGVELSFALEIQKQYPGQKIALIKYSRGGTSIDSLAANYFGSWEPDFQGQNGVNQYDHFLATMQNAYKDRDLDHNGVQDLLIPKGIVWMQGEADASFTEDIAGRYGKNLKRMMDLIRASLWTDDLPVVIGKISDSHQSSSGLVWKFGDRVRQEQENFVRNDKNAAIVRSTEKYNYSDPYHYDSEAYMDLGKQFAAAMIKLQEK